MRKFTKIMVILTCVFLAVGIGFSAAGAAMGASGKDIPEVKKEVYRATDFMVWDGDWDFDWDDEEDKSHENVASSGEDEGIRRYEAQAADVVEIDLYYEELILQAHSGNNILVEVENDPGQNVKVKSGSSKLKIESSKRKSGRLVTVFYPAGKKFSKMEICVGAGSVDIQDALFADKLEMEIGAGEFVNGDSITVKSLEVEVGAGDAELTGITAQKLDGECGVGSLSISLNGKAEDYNYNLECGIGTITIADDNYSGFAKEKEITYPGAVGEVDLECGIGEIKLSFEL